MGISLFYDIAENLLHWPHLVAVALYSVLMIASTWFSVRLMIVLSILSLPALVCSCFFVFSQPVSGESIAALCSQMLCVKSLEYISWVLLVMGSFAAINPLRCSMTKKWCVRTIVAALGFVLGTGLMVFSGVNNAMASAQTDFMLILAQQGSNIIWVLGLANSGSKKEGKISSVKIPFRLLILVIGALSAVSYEWYSPYMVGWWQYPNVFLPPLAMMLIWR